MPTKKLGYNTLAVIAFLGLAYALLAPAIPRQRDWQKKPSCKTRMKAIGLGLHNFSDEHGAFPAQKFGDPSLSWRVELLPYLDQSDLYRVYRRDQPWDSAANAEFAKTEVWLLQCPNQRHHRDDQGRFLTSYAVIYGPAGIWRDNRQAIKLDEIRDGTSNTIAVVEACGQNIVWNEPRDLDGTTTPGGINLPGNKRYESPALASSLHTGGAHVLMADGAVRFVSDNIDPATLKALVTAEGGETVSAW